MFVSPLDRGATAPQPTGEFASGRIGRSSIGLTEGLREMLVFREERPQNRDHPFDDKKWSQYQWENRSSRRGRDFRSVLC